MEGSLISMSVSLLHSCHHSSIISLLGLLNVCCLFNTRYVNIGFSFNNIVGQATCNDL